MYVFVCARITLLVGIGRGLSSECKTNQAHFVD